MKLLLSSIAACALLVASPTAAAGESAGDYLVLVQKVQDAQDAWKADLPTKPYWIDIKSTLPVWTDVQSEHMARLQRAIDDLIERAQKAALYLEDFWRMKAMIIDAKCCTEVRLLWKQAKNRDATRAQFEYVADLLSQRADAAKEHPDLRQLLQDGINKLMKKYLSGEELLLLETSYFDDETVRSMLDRALDWLEDMAIKRHATREQFEYVRDLMKDRARIWSEDLEFQTLLRRVEAELDRLMNRDLGSAGFGRDDFLKLREMCLKKARRAVSGPGSIG
jgi:hypothetical protein